MGTTSIKEKRILLAEATLFQRLNAVDIKKSCVIRHKATGDTGYLATFDAVRGPHGATYTKRRGYCTILDHKTSLFIGMSNKKVLKFYDVPYFWKKVNRRDEYVYNSVPLYDTDLNACAEAEQYVFDHYGSDIGESYVEALGYACERANIDLFRAPADMRFDHLGMALSLW